MKSILALVFVSGCFGQSVALNGTISLLGTTSVTPGGAPQISLSQTSLTYSTQLVNQDASTHTNLTPPQAITVTNNGNAALAISSISISGSNAGDWYLFEDTCSGQMVGPGGYCQVSVSFDPTGAGPRLATIAITDNASGSPHQISLNGTGTAGTTYYLSPNGNDSTGTGTLAHPWKTLFAHAGNWGPGVQFVYRGGHYQGSGQYHDLCFASNGATSTLAQPLVVKAYPGELPVMDYVNAAEMCNLGADFILDGLFWQRSWSAAILNVGGSSTNISGLILNNTFYQFSGQPIVVGNAGGVNGLTIENNWFDTWGTPTAAGGSGGFNDGIAMIVASNVLVRNNYATRVGHYFSDVAGSTAHVSNVVDSDNSVESYAGGAFAEVNHGIYPANNSGSGRFIQNNRVVHIGPGVIFSKTCFEVQGSYTVVRGNICTDQSGNNDNQTFGDVAQWNILWGDVVHNRAYNNDYYNNGGYVYLMNQRTSSNNGYTIYNHLIDNKIANDIAIQALLTEATFGNGNGNVPNEYTVWADDTQDGTWTTMTGPNSQANSIVGTSGAVTWSKNWTINLSLANAEAQSGGGIANILQTSPNWANPGSGLLPQGFELQSGSPAIAAGAHLTTTSAAGSNTNTVPVNDPFPFTDGFGMIPGDLVKIAGNPPVRVVTVYGPNSGEMLYSQAYGLRTNTPPGTYAGGYFTVSAPITVTAVARKCYSGNSRAHTLGIGSGFGGSGAFLANGSATVNMSGCTAGTLVHANLPASVTLSPGTTYWLVSSEAASSDSYSDDLPITANSAIVNEIGAASGSAVSSLTENTAVFNGQYVGLSFTYTSALPSNTLIVGTPVTFTSGATVDLANYNGSAPDMGTMEYSTTAPAISGVSETTTNATGASATWTTNTPATSQCTWGLTNYYGATSLQNSALLTSHTCYLTGLWPNTTYHYAVISTDANGGRSISSDATFTTPPHPGPVITNLYECGVNSAGTQATICWTTSTAATSQVFYDTPGNQPHDLRNASAVADTSGVTSHSVTLTNLGANQAYDYIVQSTDVSTGITNYSPISIFVTPNTATSGPIIANVTVAAQNAVNGGASNANAYGPWCSNPGYAGYSNAQATIGWQITNENAINPTIGFISASVGQNAESQYYSMGGNGCNTLTSNYEEIDTLANSNASSMGNVLGNAPSTSSAVLTNTPSMTLYRLTPNMPYYFYVQSTDASSVTNKSYRMMFVTPAMDIPDNPIIPPQTYLTETASNVTASGATITWTMPSAATCQVEYGATTSYGSLASGTSGTSCSVPITALLAGTTYHVAVIAQNAAGMSFTGPDFSFTTP